MRPSFTYFLPVLPSQRGMMNLLQNFIVPQQPLNIADRKKLFFLGIHSGEYNIFLASAIYHFQFSIWEEKLSKRVPSFITLKLDFWKDSLNQSTIQKNCKKRDLN
jgi:hypothetical protein